jgi:hypothetical protein
MALHSTQQSLQQSRTPSIPALPNEVWRTVLSQLPNPVNPNERWPPLNLVTERDRPVLHPILVVRQVCRLFRSIVNDSSFWLAGEFDPVSLISGNPDLPKYPFVKALLADGDLLETFEKKRSWTFSSFAVFTIVSETIPSFRKNVIQLAFVGGPNGERFDQSGARGDWVGVVLTNYLTLQSLTIETVEGLKLSVISEKCPELSVLRISSPPVRGLGDCSLSRFVNLRELVIDALDLPRWGQGPYALPISSAGTLEVLKLHIISSSFNFESLHLFTNLSRLSISPCDVPVFDTIITGRFNLTTLDIAILGDRVALDKIIAMVSSPALKGVKEFKFTKMNVHWQHCPEWTEEGDARFLLAISTNCQSLHTIDLAIPFHLVCFRHLGRLLNIKRVSWKGRLLVDMDAGNELSESIAQTIADAFVEFETKPVCEILILEHVKRIPVRHIIQSAATASRTWDRGVNPMRSARNGKC